LKDSVTLEFIQKRNWFYFFISPIVPSNQFIKVNIQVSRLVVHPRYNNCVESGRTMLK